MICLIYFKTFFVVLCANKTDKKRIVGTEEARSYASNRGMKYYETSASSGQNVEDMFNDLFSSIIKDVNK